MMILPVMAGYDPEAQTIFDGLWAFARSHPSEVDSRLMDWAVPDTNGNASAFDGDVDMALGLLMADAQWGSEGTVNYQAEAQTLIAGILESTIGQDSHLPMLGDWVQQNGSPYNQYTPRASDFVLVNFRAFDKETSDPVWQDVVLQSQQIMTAIQSDYSPETGLIPDFMIRAETGYQPAPPNFLESVTDGAYGYNAGRIPWRVGLDALLYDDAASRTIVRQISQWIEADTGGIPENIQAGYGLDGTKTDGRDYFTTFFTAPLGVAAMNDPAQQEWLNAIYDAVSSRQENYYEDTVNLLCLMVMTGNFWVP
jgi:endo-1,4-beta-D-glucanase Y